MGIGWSPFGSRPPEPTQRNEPQFEPKKPDLQDPNQENQNIPENIWMDKPPEKSAEPQTSLQASKQTDPIQSFDEHIKNIDFRVPQISPEIAGKFANGDFSDMSNLMESVARNAYRQSMMDVSRVLDNQLPATVAKAVETANISRKAEAFTETLFSKYPYMDSDNNRPIASSIAARFISMGHTKEKAAEQTHLFMQDMANKVDQFAQASGNANNSRPGTRGFRGPQQSYSEPNVDWAEFMLANKA